MAALVEVYLRALALSGQTLAVGGVLLGLLVLLPWRRGVSTLHAPRVLTVTAAGSSVAAAAQAVILAVTLSRLAGDDGWRLDVALATPPVQLGLGRVLGCAALAWLAARLARDPARRGGWLALLLPALVAVGGAAGLSHAAARIDGRALLLGLETVHHVAAAAWIGGLLQLLALGAAGGSWSTVLVSRFSALAAGAVVVQAATGWALSAAFVTDVGTAVGTAYGAMIATKIVLVAGVAALGAANFWMARRGGDGAMPPRFRTLLEVEAALGGAVLFVAAAIAASPVAADVPVSDRATPGEVLQRFTPRRPSLATPSHAQLAEASALTDPTAPRTPADIAWSEYNHNVAGLALLLMAMLATAERSRLARLARHWPLLFVTLSVFLLVRTDPEAWPSAGGGIWATLADPEVLQHRVLSLLPAAFGVFEWLVRTGRLRPRPWALVFPSLCVVGGTLLLAHAHTTSDVKAAHLMEISHLPLGVLGIGVGAMRWLELRLPAGGGRVPGRLWAPGLALMGVLLLFYREG